MYGLVNRAAKHMILEKFGEEAWDQLINESTVSIPHSFSDLAPYSDEVTYGIVLQAAKQFNIEVPDLLRSFGEYFVTFAGHYGYDDLMSVMADNIADFLSNLNSMHTQIGETFPKDLKTPFFWVTERKENSLILNYRPGASTRTGLTTFVCGIVEALDQRFKVEIKCTPMEATEDMSHEQFFVEWGNKKKETDADGEVDAVTATLNISKIAEDEVAAFQINDVEYEVEFDSPLSELFEACPEISAVITPEKAVLGKTVTVNDALVDGNIAVTTSGRRKLAILSLPTAAELEN